VSAWVVVDTKITNQEAYEEYKPRLALGMQPLLP